MFLLENPNDTALLKIHAKPLMVYTVNDFPDLNKSFTSLLNKLLLNRRCFLMNKISSENERCLKTLAQLGTLVPSMCKDIKIYSFIFILETPKYSVPVLFFVDEEYDRIISGHIMVRNEYKNEIIKTLGVNNDYSKYIIKKITSTIKMVLS